MINKSINKILSVFIVLVFVISATPFAICADNVTNDASNISELIIDDISIVENTHGRYIGERYVYDRIYPNFKVVFKDGSEQKNLSGTEEIFIGNKYHSLKIDFSSQSSESWVSGNSYEVNAELAGITDSFKVNIVKNNIIDLKIDDCLIIKDIDNKIDSVARVTYSDGSVIKKSLSSLPVCSYYDGIEQTNVDNVFYDTFNRYISSTTRAGKYPFIITVNNRNYSFEVTIIDNPLKSVEMVNKPNKTEYVVGEQVNLSGAKFKLNYTDNTFEYLEPIIMAKGQDSDFVVSEKFNKRIYIETNVFDFDSIGEQEIELSIAGCKVKYNVIVNENKIKTISPKSNDNKDLIITVFNSDNTFYDMKILKITFYVGQYDYKSNIGAYLADIRTDKGSYSGAVYIDKDNVKIELNIGNRYTSNALYGFKYNESSYGLDYRWGTSLRDIINSYDGEATAENIDRMIEMSVNFHYKGEIKKLSGAEIKSAVAECFSLNDIDIKLSKRYDCENDTYILDDRFLDRFNNTELLEATYEDGIFILKYLQIYGNVASGIKNVFVALDDDLKIVKIETDYPLGDVNFDDEINILDLIALKKRIVQNRTEEIVGVADLDGDGNVNALDLVKLKKLLIGVND